MLITNYLCNRIVVVITHNNIPLYWVDSIALALNEPITIQWRDGTNIRRKEKNIRRETVWVKDKTTSFGSRRCCNVIKKKKKLISSATLGSDNVKNSYGLVA